MKTWMWVTPLLIIMIVAGTWIGWTIMTATNNIDKTDEANTSQTVSEENEDISTDVVNTPVSDSIVVFKNENIQYANGHDFIMQLHSFYNETLCWGRIETASYSSQKDMAETVVTVLENAEVKNEELKKDFESIRELATTVINGDDRDAMRTLHRYFHDLDIYFNGYSYDETFQVTEFRGA